VSRYSFWSDMVEMATVAAFVLTIYAALAAVSIGALWLMVYAVAHAWRAAQ